MGSTMPMRLLLAMETSRARTDRRTEECLRRGRELRNLGRPELWRLRNSQLGVVELAPYATLETLASGVGVFSGHFRVPLRVPAHAPPLSYLPHGGATRLGRRIPEACEMRSCLEVRSKHLVCYFLCDISIPRNRLLGGVRCGNPAFQARAIDGLGVCTAHSHFQISAPDTLPRVR
jgi:hypothetical protein